MGTFNSNVTIAVVRHNFYFDRVCSVSGLCCTFFTFCNSLNTWLVCADKPVFSNLLVTKVILKRYLVLHCNPHPTTTTTTTHTKRKQTKQERDKKRNRKKWTWNWTSTYFDESQRNSCDNQWKVQAIMETGVSVKVTEAVTEATRAIILQCNSY